MTDLLVDSKNLESAINSLRDAVASNSCGVVMTIKDGSTGKWTMARLWRAWIAEIAKWMAANGATMPLVIKPNGWWYGTRPFSAEDCHELMCSHLLGVDNEGVRLSWAKKAHGGMRPATKGERFLALQKLEAWAIEKGIKLFKPNNSEMSQLENQTNE
jgi:hypothetical protein